MASRHVDIVCVHRDTSECERVGVAWTEPTGFGWAAFRPDVDGLLNAAIESPGHCIIDLDDLHERVAGTDLQLVFHDSGCCPYIDLRTDVVGNVTL